MTGEELKEKLKKKNVNFSDLAEKMGISRQDLSSKLNAQDLKISFVQEIAKNVNISLYNLIEDKGGEQNEPNTPYMSEIQRKYLQLLEEHTRLQNELIKAEREKNEILMQVTQIKAKS